ncbi:MAG: hypothetical protein M0Q88_00170 [Bacilli bacterium]|nr:hypothetical protein [Bacilli bacterium]
MEIFKEKDYTFIRVPKKVKLSEIIEYLENKAKNDSLLQDDEGNLMWHLTYEVRKPTDGSYIQILEDCVEEPRNHIPSQLKVEIYNNKITSCKFILEDEYKELYNMWFYQTFIEVDV